MLPGVDLENDVGGSFVEVLQGHSRFSGRSS